MEKEKKKRYDGIRERKNGTFEKRFTINKKRYSVYGETITEVKEKAKALEKRIEEGCTGAEKTLDSLCAEWIKIRTGNISDNTICKYSGMYRNHISKYLGTMKVNKIDTDDIEKMTEELKKELSIESCKQVIDILRIMLNYAKRKRIISRNPVSDAEPLKDNDVKAVDTIHRALTEQEQKDFMQEMKQDYYYDFIALLLCTGMRFGEAAALTWRDIDYKNNVIKVNKTLTYDLNRRVVVGNTTKTKAGKRDIPMNESIRQILQNVRAKSGNVVSISNVFSGARGSLVYNATVNYAIKSAIKRLSNKGIVIEPFTVHALRDTFATRFIEQGGNPQTLKKILGHSSLAMTMDLYAHVLNNTKQKEMDQLRIIV